MLTARKSGQMDFLAAATLIIAISARSELSRGFCPCSPAASRGIRLWAGGVGLMVHGAVLFSVAGKGHETDAFLSLFSNRFSGPPFGPCWPRC